MASKWQPGIETDTTYEVQQFRAGQWQAITFQVYQLRMAQAAMSDLQQGHPDYICRIVKIESVVTVTVVEIEAA